MKSFSIYLFEAECRKDTTRFQIFKQIANYWWCKIQINNVQCTPVDIDSLPAGCFFFTLLDITYEMAANLCVWRWKLIDLTFLCRILVSHQSRPHCWCFVRAATIHFMSLGWKKVSLFQLHFFRRVLQTVNDNWGKKAKKQSNTVISGNCWHELSILTV